MRWDVKPKLVVAGALLAACAFAGGAYAASEQTTPAASRQVFLSDVAKRLGTTPQKLTAALEGAYFDELNAAVKAGRLTRAQAGAIEHAVRQRGLGPVGPLFMAPAPLAPGKAPRGFGPRPLPTPPHFRWFRLPRPPHPGAPIPGPPPPASG